MVTYIDAYIAIFSNSFLCSNSPAEDSSSNLIIILPLATNAIMTYETRLFINNEVSTTFLFSAYTY